SAGEPRPNSSVGEPRPNSSAGDPRPNSSAGEPRPNSSVGDPRAMSSTGRPERSNGSLLPRGSPWGDPPELRGSNSPGPEPRASFDRGRLERSYMSPALSKKSRFIPCASAVVFVLGVLVKTSPS